MPDPITPSIPPTPDAASAWEIWDVYLRAVGEHNRVAALDVSSRRASADEANAEAMNRLAAAHEVLGEQLPGGEMDRKPTRAEMVLQMIPHFKQSTVPGLSAVDLATVVVDKYLAAFPDAARP